MTKLSFDIIGIIVDVAEFKGKQLTQKTLEELITEFENKPMDEKIALIQSVRITSDGALSFANVKIGKMVETNDGKYGMIIKINKKNILVSTSRGIISGPPAAFKETTKTVDELKEAHKEFYKYSNNIDTEGKFLQVKIKDTWKKGITLNSLSRNSIKVYFYETNTSINLTEAQLNNPLLVKKEG